MQDRRKSKRVVAHRPLPSEWVAGRITTPLRSTLVSALRNSRRTTVSAQQKSLCRIPRVCLEMPATWPPCRTDRWLWWSRRPPTSSGKSMNKPSLGAGRLRVRTCRTHMSSTSKCSGMCSLSASEPSNRAAGSPSMSPTSDVSRIGAFPPMSFGFFRTTLGCSCVAKSSGRKPRELLDRLPGDPSTRPPTRCCGT